MSLTQGFVTIFDPIDSALVNKGRWWSSVRQNTVYAMRTDRIEGNLRLHREILGASANFEVDHINGIGLDNRRQNLRIATHSQNQRNTRSRRGSSSRFLGVSFDKNSNLWRARIQSNGALKIIGRFQTEIAAAVAYDMWAKEMHGDFARLNFEQKKAPTTG